jgi:hypothetical protein
MAGATQELTSAIRWNVCAAPRRVGLSEGRTTGGRHEKRGDQADAHCHRSAVAGARRRRAPGARARDNVPTAAARHADCVREATSTRPPGSWLERSGGLASASARRLAASFGRTSSVQRFGFGAGSAENRDIGVGIFPHCQETLAMWLRIVISVSPVRVTSVGPD